MTEQLLLLVISLLFDGSISQIQYPMKSASCHTAPGMTDPTKGFGALAYDGDHWSHGDTFFIWKAMGWCGNVPCRGGDSLFQVRKGKKRRALRVGR